MNSGSFKNLNYKIFIYKSYNVNRLQITYCVDMPKRTIKYRIIKSNESLR